MFGLVIAAHGRLAEEMVSTAEQIVGALPAVATCSVQPGTAADVFRDAVRAAIRSVDSGQGVLVLVDLFGGSPCTQCLMVTGGPPVEVVTGVNLPMLIKANSLRAEATSLPDLAAALVQYGQRNILCASSVVRDAAPTRTTP